MFQVSQAELFARSFQAQVARNPGAACLTLPILRELDVMGAIDALCPSGHTISHGRIVGLLAVNRLQAPRLLYKVAAWLEQAGLEAALGVQAVHATIPAWARPWMRSTPSMTRSGSAWR